MLFLIVFSQIVKISKNFVFWQIGEFTLLLDTLLTLFLANITKMMVLEIMPIQLILIIEILELAEITVRMVLPTMECYLIEIVKFLFI